MTKGKILFIIPTLCQGGLEHSLITALKLLDKSKYQVTLLIMQQVLDLLPLVPQEVEVLIDKESPHYYRKPRAVWLKGVSEISGRIGKQSIKEMYSEQLKRYIHLQRTIHPAKDIIGKRDFDVVVSYAVGMCTETALHVKAKKRVVFFHSSIDLNHEKNVELFPKLDGIIAVSQGVKDMLCCSYDNIQDKVYVLENYVDAELVIAKANQPLLNGFVSPENKLVLCTCGRFSKEKGFDLAVESAHILKKSGVDFIWYFIGDGALREALETQIAEYSLQDNIVITGYVDNPFSYIKMCEIYVQPSYHESFGLTIKEAMVLGKPIVSTDTVGAHTLLDNSEYGEIVDVNAEALAQGIIDAVEKKTRNKYVKFDISVNESEKIEYIRKLEKLIDN